MPDFSPSPSHDEEDGPIEDLVSDDSADSPEDDLEAEKLLVELLEHFQKTNRTHHQMKLVIRRLPQKMTEKQFGTLMGEEWKVGAGKVDWVSFKPGRTSQE